MKLNEITVEITALAGMVAVFLAGCSTPTIPIEMNVSGEIKLNGVSKIALADFNSLPGDSFSGVVAADAETCAIVKRAVASAFYKSPMYQVVDMDVEKQIADEAHAKPRKRFDAVVYGRLWWQTTQESVGQYPQKFTLESWRNVPYTKKNLITGKEEQQIAKVTTRREDVLRMLDYRVKNSTLMLTLSIYRLENSGDIVKITDTYQVTNQGFTLMNGEMRLDSVNVGLKDDNAVSRLQSTGKEEKKTTAYEEMFEKKTTAYEEMFEEKQMSLADQGKNLAGAMGSAILSNLAPGIDALACGLLGKKEDAAQNKETDRNGTRRVDANGKIVLTQETPSMPTELQAKLMLASSVSQGLVAKLAPSKVRFDVPAELGDAKLEHLLKNGAFRSAKEYSLFVIRQKMGRQICDELAEFLPGFAEHCAYPIPDSKEKIEFPSEASAVSYLSSQGLDVYFYVLGICSEAAQNMDEALEYHRFAFQANPSKEYALGISRVYLAMDENARLKQTRKAKNKATKRSRLD